MASMTAGFRLISAETADRVERSRWRPERNRKIINSIKVAFDSSGEDYTPNYESHVSVVLGRNGQGKSRLLSAIASSFQLLQTYGRSRPMRHFPLKNLIFRANGQLHEITSPEGKTPRLLVDGEERPLSDAILPSRVIALSMTPLDKFPIGPRSTQLDLFDEERPDVYSYFGMRDRMGRASVSLLLFRAVEGLFARHDHGDRIRIAKVFDLIGYQPTLDVVFRLDSTSFLEKIATNSLYPGSLGPDQYSRNRMFQVMEADENKKISLMKAADTALRIAQKGFCLTSVDVRSPSAESIDTFLQLQTLRREGLARLYAVEAHKVDGDTIDLKQASSGELSIAISFMSLASSLDDSSLILIDEPETNLHPEWQAKYVELLTSTFSGFVNCHYILATHSPLILSDSPPSATLASVSDEVPTKGSDVAGRPVDYLLAKAFQTVNGTNYYLQEELIKALRLAADGAANTHDFSETVDELVNLGPLIRDNPGIVDLIASLKNIRDREGRKK
ncbi:AAA family ATPase [Methylobacterium sp.]|jgi:predicted ATPase|uniref:AAA family ATPase n=2 Tax=Bacteria TaxID=2 RepID=UPI000C5FE162|nr:AAA family ATPase [Methylobacterium sp.]MBP27821.1 hypothetical protein [Methylobacterium sp.]